MLDCRESLAARTGGDQLSTGGPCCGPTHSSAEQRLGSAAKCMCGFLSLCACCSVSGPPLLVCRWICSCKYIYDAHIDRENAVLFDRLFFFLT